MNENATVYVVDDDQAVRDAIARLVRDMGLKAKTCSSAEEFLDSYERIDTDCLVLDVRMTGMSGMVLLEKLSERNLSIPVILVTGHGDIKMAVSALKKGVIDFIEKPFREQELWDKISEALEISDKSNRITLKGRKLAEKISLLTSQERRILIYLLASETDKQIANNMCFTRRTAAYHRVHILKKLEVISIIELSKLIAVHDISI